ncbi:MAG: TolC family protein [Bacteroidota bacterium]
MNHNLHQTKIAFLLFFFAIFNLVSAQEPLSMAEAIERALQNNYQIQIAKKETELAQNNNNWKAAGRVPTVNLNFNLDNNFAGQNNPASFLQKFTSVSSGVTAGIEASYILFDGYRVKVNKRRFEALEKQSEGNIKIAIEESIQAVILAYYQALIQAASVNTLEELIRLSRDRIDYQETRKEFGQAGRFDLLQSEDAYFDDSTNYLIALNSYDLALRNLNLAMGEDNLELTYQLTDGLSFIAESYAFADLQEKMLNSNQNLQNLYVNLSLANIERQSAQSNKYPTIALSGGANYGASISGINIIEAPPNFTVDSPVTNSNYGFFLGLGATYNLYNGGATKRAVENAGIQENIAQLNIEDLKRRLSSQLSNTLATYNSQRSLLQLIVNRVNNAKENVGIAQERFRAGQINSFDYRTIQLNYLNAVQSQLQAVFNLKNTETTLIRLTGGLIR